MKHSNPHPTTKTIYSTHKLLYHLPILQLPNIVHQLPNWFPPQLRTIPILSKSSTSHSTNFLITFGTKNFITSTPNRIKITLSIKHSIKIHSMITSFQLKTSLPSTISLEKLKPKKNKKYTISFTVSIKIHPTLPKIL